MATEDNDVERKKLYNWLRRWTAISLTGLAVGLTLFDALDDMFWGNLYAGCPVWLSGAVYAIVGSLFAAEVIKAVRR